MTPSGCNPLVERLGGSNPSNGTKIIMITEKEIKIEGGFIEVPLESFIRQRESSEDDRIKDRCFYLAKIHKKWYLGTFSKQWFGWTLNIGSHNVQLNVIEKLYEVILPNDGILDDLGIYKD